MNFIFTFIRVMSVWLPVKRCSWDQKFTSSTEMIFRVSSVIFNTCYVLFLSHRFSRRAVTPMCSPRFEFAVTLFASRSEEALLTLLLFDFKSNNSIKSGQYCVLDCLRPRKQYYSFALSILSIKHLSKVFTFTVF